MSLGDETWDRWIFGKYDSLDWCIIGTEMIK